MPRMNQTVVKKANSDSSKQSSKQSSRKKSVENGSIKKESKQSSTKTSSKTKNKRTSNVKYYTHDGHALTVLEAKFIDLYIETGNGRKSVIDAGYKTTQPGQYA